MIVHGQTVPVIVPPAGGCGAVVDVVVGPLVDVEDRGLVVVACFGPSVDGGVDPTDSAVVDVSEEVSTESEAGRSCEAASAF